ncbi:hypothetical protein QR680_000413 [Steinernema hermaphroditum]|uniref:Uncharacterized protein n=1 Tax=Steinernema hermaphroditum TaxID=289476 RepID=A0AA39GWH6_9BILA|nr:hypothetical protein QR680_000413 [Steinernema hermaphroditum]
MLIVVVVDVRLCLRGDRQRRRRRLRRFAMRRTKKRETPQIESLFASGIALWKWADGVLVNALLQGNNS